MIFIATVIGLFILLFVVELGINNILSIEKEKVSETSGKRVYYWGHMLLFGFLLVLFWLMLESSDMQKMFYLTSYLVVLFGYQSIMEFIFIKESRQYISSLVLFIVVLVIMLNIESYPFLAEGFIIS